MARLTKKVKLGVPRFLVLVLAIAVVGIQYPLWVGKGSNATLLDLQDQLKTQKEKNAALLKLQGTKARRIVFAMAVKP